MKRKMIFGETGSKYWSDKGVIISRVRQEDCGLDVV